MRLRRLTIKGFKSFANETTLHFNDAVIGVVGPNGSGKSNIVDAIRWVLGEQKSKELRLDAMSDVIFNGTKKRKEAAAATVELVFENDKKLLSTDYQTVAISRTLYRSGESEYRLNDVVCRLKDIKTLFLDTGIGSNSYAIIALGMVDDILADKEDARRRMFEQAAGISKYKIRKRETLQKLTATTQDLERLDDVLFEIEGSMKTLEKQAKRTRKYFDLKDEYKELSIQLALISLKELKAKYKKLQAFITEKEDLHRKENTIIIQKEAEVEKKKRQNLDKEITLTGKQKELNDLTSKLRNLESEKKLLEQQILFNDQNLQNIRNAIQESQSQLAILDPDIKKLEDAKVETQEDLQYLESKRQTALTFLEEVRQKFLQVKEDVDARTKTIQNLTSQYFQLEKDSAITQNQIDNSQNEITRLQEQLQSGQQDFEGLKIESERVFEILESKNESLANLQKEEEARMVLVQGLEKDRDSIQDQLIKINRSIDSKKNEFDLVKSMVESFEGFPESIKFLAQNWKKKPPVLADVLDADERYKTAIEQYIDPYLNFFLVDTAEDAYEAIKLLHAAQKGKVHFFILSEIDRRYQDFTFSDVLLPDVIPAWQCVKTIRKYEPLVKFLLQNVYISTKSVEDWRYEADLENATILSEGGHLVKSPTTISGGSVGLFEGKKIGRRNNLEDLERSLVGLDTQKLKLGKNLNDVKEEIAKMKAISTKDLQQKLTQEIKALDQQRIGIGIKLDSFKATREKYQIDLEKAQEKLASLWRILAEYQSSSQSIKGKLTEEEGRDGANSEALQSLTDQLSQSTEKYNQSNIAVIKQQNLLENQQRDLKFKSDRQRDLSIRLANDNQKLERAQKEYLDTQERLTIIGKQLQQMYVDRKGFQVTLNEAEQAYFEAKNAIQALEDDVKLRNRQIQQIQSEVNNAKDDFNDVKFRINAVGDRLQIEFNIALQDIIDNPVEEQVELHVLQDQVQKMKDKLSTFGEINPMALEAYEEIKQRYDTIISQRVDILEAKEALMKTIKEIEDNATHQFLASFEQIRQNFIMVFRSLFTEDDACDLILLNPDDPIESEIEIVAKPKGKKPKSLNQLSGGEKTLTATALLFALYLLKPAPFCIFDEVDAPLDDANIEKFNRIIKKFSDHSQFIIVTHNKATMAAVDVIYGVFMQEQGVSNVAQVDFRNFGEETVFETVNAQI